MILYIPCSCSNTLAECQPLPLHLLLIHHPWPTGHQFLYHSLHTTGLPAMRCKSFAYSSASLRLGPEFARSSLREKLDYLLLHPGQRGLCCHGQMGTSRWSIQERPCKVLRLHREYIRWWDLPTILCLQAGRHHKEVWQIHQWASSLDMPN